MDGSSRAHETSDVARMHPEWIPMALSVPFVPLPTQAEGTAFLLPERRNAHGRPRVGCPVPVGEEGLWEWETWTTSVWVSDRASVISIV